MKNANKTELMDIRMDDLTYSGDCMCFSELVNGSIQNGHSKDESPVYEVDEKSRRIPDRTRELHASRSFGVKEVFQVDPGY